jgi:hypothetical protein
MDQQAAKRRGLDELRDLRQETDRLQDEVSAMRRALEVTLERWDTFGAPDYSQEFGLAYQSLGKLEKRLSAVEKSQLIENPNDILAQINDATDRKISDQAETIKAAARAVQETVSFQLRA